MTIFFYIFAGLVIIGSLAVIFSTSPVHSLLALIFTFFNAAGLMILLGAEFIAMILIIVYVGAVAVLFLFTIMMLDMKTEPVFSGFKKSPIINSTIGALVCVDLTLVILLSIGGVAIAPETTASMLQNTNEIGALLYTDFILPFQMAGIILFVAMISCVTLTIRHDNKQFKTQNIDKQNSRTKLNSISLEKITINQGVDDIDYGR